MNLLLTDAFADSLTRLAAAPLWVGRLKRRRWLGPVVDFAYGPKAPRELERRCSHNRRWEGS
jgi:hypothetical protein